jgi:UDP-N-acetylmuramoyl-tripeptide--D-alanyl-D-alanine ligase
VKQWSTDDIVEALGYVCTPNDMKGKSISIDTRTLMPGDIYVALKGHARHGADFVADAFAKGACSVVADQDLDLPNQSYIRVDDTLKALENLGRFARDTSPAKRIAVTGSCGKTTTKEWLGQILTCYGNTVRSRASYNNHIGVPLSLTQLSSATQFGVFEIGMNHGGEISPLTQLVCPHVAIITTIAEAHMGHFKSLQEIAEEKASIFDGLQDDGIAIIPRDAPFYDLLREKALAKTQNVLTFSMQETASATLNYSQVLPEGGLDVSVNILGENVHIQTPFRDSHLLPNIFAILLAIRSLGLPLGPAIKAIENLAPLSGRGRQEKILFQGMSLTLIDDSYNASPSSMRAALAALKEKKNNEMGRQIIILGEMRELGEFSKKLHEDLLPFLCELDSSLVFCVGAEISDLYSSLPNALKGGFAHSVEKIIPLVEKNLQNNDVVFVKGSNGSGVHKLVACLKSTLSHEIAAA